MGRRESREAALQILFQLEFSESSEVPDLNQFWKNKKNQDSAYAQQLVHGVMAHKEEIDGLIQSHSQNWRVSRMLLIDRNIMRLAVYELLFEKDMAVAVVINEAVELAKKFGSSESARFINGVLDALSKNPKARKKDRGNSNG
ncbi:MAG TPA: transcription antitermination factor NusB [Acidobacteriota bacterium]|nr:transcription antitermination factor NusB [Acidobacteriota bacterium]